MSGSQARARWRWSLAPRRARDRSRLSFAFTGGIYGWPYYCGVAAYLQRHGLLAPEARLYGTSSGNVAALYLAAGIDAEREGLEACMASNDRHNHPWLGPYFRPDAAQSAFYEVFAAALPADVHVRASGRLHVVVTQLTPLVRRRVVSRFPTRAALLAVVASSMAIPGHGVRVAFDASDARLGWCVDGGLLGGLEDDDRPGWHTVRVSIWHSGRTARLRGLDISPSRPLRWREVLTIQSRDQRRALLELGREDARKYFEEEAGEW